MGDITVEYSGSFPMRVRIGEHEVLMDVPPSLGGTATTPSPTDYFIAGIAACKVAYAAAFAQRRGLNVSGITGTAEVGKGDSCVETIHVKLHVDGDLPADMKSGMERMVGSCYVGKSVKRPTELTFEIEC